jgi:hypothetical protein
MSDRLVALGLLAVCSVFYWQSFAIRRPPFAAFETFDSAAFPRGVAVLLAVFALILLVRGGGAVVPRVTRDGLRRWLARYQLPLISLGAFTTYALLMAPIGWIASTIGYLVAMQLAIFPRRNVRDLAAVVAGSVVFTVALGVGFERFLHVVLPRPDLF